MPVESEDNKWHLDKKVPITLIGAIVAQSFVFGWYAATQSARTDAHTQRIEAIEHRMDGMAPQAERIIRVETKVDGMAGTLTEIKQMLRPRERPAGP